MWKYLAVFTVCICGIQSQLPFPGRCPDVKVVEDFDLTKYMGKWYEQYRYANLFEIFGKCNTAEYSINDNGGVNVHNEQRNKFTGDLKAIDGNAVPAGEITQAKFLVNFPVGGYHANAPYWVLDTDYETYSVVWSCTQYPQFNTRFAWLLTREKDVSDDVVTRMNAVLDKYDISRKFLVSADQKNCS